MLESEIRQKERMYILLTYARMWSEFTIIVGMGIIVFLIVRDLV